MMAIPRSEHPNPQCRRENWRSLNGTWEFETDTANAGEEERFYNREHFSRKITVPFCPESSLSGIGEKNFMNAVWYKRTFTLSASELSGSVILHFGAVDYRATVCVNDHFACVHTGGFTPFEADITSYVHPGENTVVVRAYDDARDSMQPSGKQSSRVYSHDCFYTRTTGIWQTVWLEFVPKCRILSFRITPHVEEQTLQLDIVTNGAGQLRAEATYQGKPMGRRTLSLGKQGGTLLLPLSELHLWEVGNGRLYDLTLTFGEDTVFSYFGMRSIAFDGIKFLLNGRSVFQRLVLDQGFYPDGIYTAPNDEALLADIKMSQAVGFNGARLHEKVFEPRFLYHCDKEGYLVWGEYPNWGMDFSRPEMLHVILPEWLEEVARDYNHPSIVGWCPLNEVWDYERRPPYLPNISVLYDATKAADPTRPCIDTSGGYHVKTDIFCTHDYEQNPDVFGEHYDRLMTEGYLFDYLDSRETYRGEPTFLSEYGGTAWDADNGWGYGNAPKTEEEFLARFRGLTEVLMRNDRMFGLCYTQLYDVEQEKNGLYTYDRKPKFPTESLASVLKAKAAIED